MFKRHLDIKDLSLNLYQMYSTVLDVIGQSKMNERLHYITLSQILLERYNKLRILTWRATFALKTIEGSK